MTSKLLKQKIFVLLSGGIDSTTTLAIALEDFPEAEVEAVSVDYGQRHKVEINHAKSVANFYNVTHSVINLAGLMTGMLVDKGSDNEIIPEKSYAELPDGISPTYVSFRNGLMLSILAARAQSWVMETEKAWSDAHSADEFGDGGPYPGSPEAEAYIYTGVHADDGANWAYPDCTPEFIGGMANAIHIGTYFKVRVRAPLQYMDKAEVVRVGDRLGVPYRLTWSCYKGDELHCGKCPTCLSRKQAFIDLGIPDPTSYATDSEIPF